MAAVARGFQALLLLCHRNGAAQGVSLFTRGMPGGGWDKLALKPPR